MEVAVWAELLTTLLGLAFSPGAHRKLSSKKDEDQNDEQSDRTPSPFLTYYDTYSWSSVYEEVNACLASCSLLYALADMKRIAPHGEVDALACVLELPMSRSQLLDLIERHKNSLSDADCFDFSLDLLRHRGKSSSRLSYDECTSSESRKAVGRSVGLCNEEISIVSFDDKLVNEELAYMIECDHFHKRIIVCFHDFVTTVPLKSHMKEMPNPLKKYDKQTPTVHVRNDFYSNLFGPSSCEIGIAKKRSAYHIILQELVIPLMKQWTGYKLYVTGHNSGAALATLFGFRAASQPDSKIPKPVTIISLGCPWVGDQSLRSAHQLLEGMGKLRHLRVSGHNDVVTLQPTNPFWWCPCAPHSNVCYPFKPVGMNLLLYGEVHRSFEISYLSEEVLWLSELFRGWMQTWPLNSCWNASESWRRPASSLREYHRRLAANKERLARLHLNDFYCSTKIVGDLVSNAKSVLSPRRPEKLTHVIFLCRERGTGDDVGESK